MAANLPKLMYGYTTALSMSVLRNFDRSSGQYTNQKKVGHDESALTGSRTLESLYINPILDILERQNPESPFITSPTKK
jgi:hypothetical protein